MIKTHLVLVVLVCLIVVGCGHILDDKDVKYHKIYLSEYRNDFTIELFVVDTLVLRAIIILNPEEADSFIVKRYAEIFEQEVNEKASQKEFSYDMLGYSEEERIGADSASVMMMVFDLLLYDSLTINSFNLSEKIYSLGVISTKLDFLNSKIEWYMNDYWNLVKYEYGFGLGMVDNYWGGFYYEGYKDIFGKDFPNLKESFKNLIGNMSIKDLRKYCISRMKR